MTENRISKIRKIKNLIEACSRIVVFTGAGISTESGVSDYRSQGGLWDRYQPVTIQEFLSDEDKRREFWRRKKKMYAQIRKAKPNPGHLAIAELEKYRKLLGVITQNIDGLHQSAGNQNVLELHGTHREAICLNCQKIRPFDPIYEKLIQGEGIPLCPDCGGFLKTNTISFGQPLSPDILQKAFRWAEHCDLLLAVGSTLIVEPAASIPLRAKQAGAALVILNRDPTPLDRMADEMLHTPIGDTLQSVIKRS